MESSKFKVQSSKRKILFAICYLLIANLMGCATIIDAPKGIVGISTKALEDGRKDAIKKTFNYDYNTCYERTKNILANAGTYAYAQDVKKEMIAVYVSQEDTTPVGIFFKAIDANNTQVEVSSLSTFAKEFIAAKIFAALEKPPVTKAQTKQVNLNISNAQGQPGQKDIVVPILVSDVSGLGFISCQLTLKYDSDLLTLTDVNSSGTLTKNWSAPVYNLKQEEVLISLYGTNELSGSGVLVNLIFTVDANAKAGTSDLNLSQATFNDGSISLLITDGVFTVISQ